jgi:hypothetical protein
VPFTSLFQVPTNLNGEKQTDKDIEGDGKVTYEQFKDFYMAMMSSK